MNYEEIKEVILKCKNKVNLKMYSIDFAKGYCSGVLNTSNKINEDEYNELYKIIDDVFDSKRRMTMTESEAIKEIETSLELAEMCTPNKEREKEIKAYKIAIQALKEIREYRELGTVEELKSMKENGAFTGVELSQIAVNQMKLKKYMEIGTVEEFKALKEKNEPKKPIDKIMYLECPSCEDVGILDCGYCSVCGQKLDWELEQKESDYER